MRKLILATTSAIVLGLAGAGPLYAQSNPTPPAATAPVASPTTGAEQSTPPQTGAATTGQAMSPTGSNAEYNKPYTAGTSPSQPMPTQITSSEIRQVQQKLRGENLYRGRIDGRWGPETRQALSQYQRKSGLPVTARLDQDTLSNLLGTGVGQGSSTPPNSSNGVAPSSGAGTSGTTMPANPSSVTK